MSTLLLNIASRRMWVRMWVSLCSGWVVKLRIVFRAALGDSHCRPHGACSQLLCQQRHIEQ
jgi:hypothetical protein